MDYLVDEKRLDGHGNLANMHNAFAQFDQQAAEESFSLILRVFQEVPELEKLEVKITQSQVGPGFHRVTQGCNCIVALRGMPLALELPGTDWMKTDLVKQFKSMASPELAKFQFFLARYFLETWPAFSERSHLFGGVGSLLVTREGVAALLQPGMRVNLTDCVMAMFVNAEFSMGDEQAHRSNRERNIQ